MSYAVLGIGNPNADTPHHPVPMVVDDDGTWAFFKYREDSEKAANSHPYFSAVGFEIIEWPFCEPNHGVE